MSGILKSLCNLQGFCGHFVSLLMSNKRGPLKTQQTTQFTHMAADLCRPWVLLSQTVLPARSNSCQQRPSHVQRCENPQQHTNVLLLKPRAAMSGTTAEAGKKWNESGFRPPLCTYRLNWARRTSWGWWDDWDDTVLQTQDSKFEPWRSEAEHATSRSRRLPTIPGHASTYLALIYKVKQLEKLACLCATVLLLLLLLLFHAAASDSATVVFTVATSATTAWCFILSNSDRFCHLWWLIFLQQSHIKYVFSSDTYKKGQHQTDDQWTSLQCQASAGKQLVYLALQRRSFHRPLVQWRSTYTAVQDSNCWPCTGVQNCHFPSIIAALSILFVQWNESPYLIHHEVKKHSHICVNNTFTNIYPRKGQQRNKQDRLF